MWWRPLNQGRIGLIAGQGEFPVLFAKAALSVKRPVVVFGVEGITDKRVEDFSSEAHYFELGALQNLVDLLRSHKIRQVAFAGGVPKKKIYDPTFRLDRTAQDFMRSSRHKGDDHLLRAFELFLKTSCGVSVIDSRTLLKNALAPRGVMTRRKPDESEWQELKFGLKMARAVGKLDIGQTVVVRQGVVLAVEALEGTDEAIRRGGALGLGGIVVKTAKPNQDLRFDLPCVGADTLDTMEQSSCKVLGVEAHKTIMISREALIEKANHANMAIVGL